MTAEAPRESRFSGRSSRVAVILAAVAMVVAAVVVWQATRSPQAEPGPRRWTPTPTGASPPAPVMGPVRRVPSSIPDDCSRPVDAEINALVAAAPDGSVVEFPAGRCYAQDGQIEVNDRKDLTIDGRGSTFKAVTPGDTCRANWRIQGGTNITLRNMVVEGKNDTGFEGPRWPDYRAQCQHGYSFDSVQGGRLLASRSSNTIGDAFAVGPDIRPPRDNCRSAPNRNILIDGFSGTNAGRTASITHGDGVTISNSFLGDIFDNAIDLETDDDCMYSRNIRIVNNRFGRFRNAMVAYTGAEKDGRGGGLEISGNITEAEPRTCFPAIVIVPPNNIKRNNFLIVNNQLKTLGDGIKIERGRNVRIEGNIVAKDSASCGIDSTHVVDVLDSENVNVHGNIGLPGSRGGFGGELAVDAATTGLTRVEGSTVATFPPLPEPSDAPPVAEVVTPKDGSTVSGVVDVKVAARGDNLRRAEFSIDGTLVKTDVGPSYTYQWDTDATAKGRHTLAVTIFNFLDVSSTTSVTVTVA